MYASLPSVIARRILPSASMTHRFSIPFSSDVNAMDLPSGERRG